MKEKNLITHRYLFKIIAIIAFCVLAASTAMAELKIDTVSPTLGKLGEDLTVTISGKGFDSETRVSMSVDTGNSAAIIGSVDPWGYSSTNNVTVYGNTAFVVDNYYGLLIIDISDPTTPVTIGSVETPGCAKDVAVYGNTAFVADCDSGLQIIDVSDPTAPAIVAAEYQPGYRSANAVAVFDNKAFVADGFSGLQIIDIANPRAPAIIASIDTPGIAIGVAVSGNTVFVADEDSGLQIIDITVPRSPAIIGSVSTPGKASGVAISLTFNTLNRSFLLILFSVKSGE